MSAPSYVIGPHGQVMTLADLPSSRTIRWTRQRKAEIAIAVRDGLTAMEDVCDRYGITPEELAAWQTGLRCEGLRALMVKHIQTPGVRFRQ